MKTGVIIAVVLIVIIVIAAFIIYNPSDENQEIVNEGNEEQEPLTYTELSAPEAKDIVDNTPGLIILDVSDRYGIGHLPGAINYYVGDGTLDEAIPTLDKEATYLVYCHFESASILGAQKLVDAGFTDVYRLKGGYGVWLEFGYPYER